jgi:hypothetical protein
MFGAMVLAGLALAVGTLTSSQGRVQAAPEDDIEATVQALVDAWNAGDAAAIVALFTEEGLADTFEIEDPAQAVASVSQTIEDFGPLAGATVTDIFVTSGNATGIVDLQFEFGFSLYEEWKFYFLDGGWKIGPGELASRPVPEGVATVPMALSEYAFTFDKTATSSGNFAFTVANVGQEEHELLLFKLDTNDALLDVATAFLEAEEFPPYAEFVTLGGFYKPGEGNTVVFEGGLDPGRYGLICFFPAPDGTPHLALGMVNDFTVAGAGGITAPSTGDGGLLPEPGGVSTWLLIAASLMLALGGVAGLVRSRA